MTIISVDGSKVIQLQGFEIEGEILLSDADRMGEHKKVNVVLPEDYLKFLIEDRDILKRLNLE